MSPQSSCRVGASRRLGRRRGLGVRRRLRAGLHFLEQLREFLLAVFLVQTLVDVGDLRRVHGTELRPAHRAELRFLVKIIR